MKDYYGYRATALCAKNKPPKVSLKKGDVILESVAFVYVVESDKRGQYCEQCLEAARSRSLFPCKKCGFHFYCSDGCAQQSWDEVHRRECANLKRCLSKDFTVPNYARLLARIIFRLQEGGEKYEEKYCMNKGRKFKDLMNHYKDIKNDEGRMKDVRSLMDILREYIGEQNVPNECDFIGIYGRALVNRFCLNDELNVPMGSGVYLAASIFDHSCVPNAHPSFIGKKLYIRTLVDIPELNLDKVRISYVDCVNGTEQRRKDLFKNWYFWCDCELCNDEERKYYESFIMCENHLCEEKVKVPERYSAVDCVETIKKESEKDSSIALKNALQQAKIQYKFASVPVNPFASADAMMSYLFYNKDRYKLASDSDLTECTDSQSPANTPTRQKSPEPLGLVDDQHRPHDEKKEEQEDEYQPVTNGADDAIQKIEEVSSAQPEKMSKKGMKNKDKKTKEKAGSLVNGTAEENGDKILDAPAKRGKVAKSNDVTSKNAPDKALDGTVSPNTGAKNKTLSKKKKSSNLKEESPRDDSPERTSLTNGLDTKTQLTNGGSHDHSNESFQQVNGYTAEDENEDPSHLENTAPKKKKLIRRHVYEKSDVMCNGCKCYIDLNTLREYRAAIRFTVQRLSNMKEDSPNFQVVLDVIDRQGSVVPRMNVWRVRTIDFAFNAAFYGGAWVLAMKYGMENLDGMKFLYGDFHPTLGLFYMKLGKVHMNLKLYRQGLHYVGLAKDMLSVGMGPNHPFITGELYTLEMMANEDPEILMEKRLARMVQTVTEIVCPCCGKKKVIKSFHEQKEEERPWERDRKYKDEMKKDSEFFNTSY